MRCLMIMTMTALVCGCAGTGDHVPATDHAVVPRPPVDLNGVIAKNEPDGFRSGTARLTGVSRGHANVSVVPLAPDHIGRTVSGQPVLYWYLSKPVAFPVVFVLIDTRTVRVAHDVKMAPPFQAGVQAIHLEQLGISLEPEVPYRWYIDVVVDDHSPSRDIVSGGMIERVRPDADVPDLTRTSTIDAVRQYAAAGFWYDAISTISDRIAAAPADPLLRRQRASLLRQIGLQEVADWDLAHVGAE